MQKRQCVCVCFCVIVFVWRGGEGGAGGLERLENDRWRLCVSVCERVNTQCCSGLFFAQKKMQSYKY